MKNLFILFLVLLLTDTAIAQTKNYYVSASGDNDNDGLTAATAWQTISKVNSSFSIILPGDSILFRRGDVFYGALVVGNSGSSGKPIVFSAYGTGANPVITGFTTLSSWTLIGNGIYQATAPGKATMNMVIINNVPQALGRYPNATDDNGGYLKYENFSGTTSITDNELTSATDWTGADVVIRKKLWVLDRHKITDHSGGTLTYANGGSTYDGTKNWGYFITNDLRTLDQLGEWCFNSSTKKIQMYFGTASPSSYTVKASTVDTLFSAVKRNYIDVNNIEFDGANGWGIYTLNSTNINIQNCDVTNGGKVGIMVNNGSNILVENCTVNNILSNGIQLNNAKVSNSTIRNCVVKNIGMLAGMGMNGGMSYKAIIATVSKGLVIEYNRVDSAGYVGIEFQGSNVSVNNNVVNYFCVQKEDGAGIYTWSGSTEAVPGIIHTNRVIRDNVIMNAIGAPASRFASAGNVDVAGIHLDGRSLNIDVLDNTIFNSHKDGIHTNSPLNVKIKGNTFYNNDGAAISMMRYAYIGDISGLAIKNNICYGTTSEQRNFFYGNTGINEPTPTTFQSAMQHLGEIDSNYYSQANAAGFVFDVYATTGGANIPQPRMSLAGWQSFSGNDPASKRPAKEPVEYELISLSGSNEFSKGRFTSDIQGVTLFGSNVTGAWDNTNKISGGCYKMSFSNPTPFKYATLHAPVGAINSAKKYILRFSTYGTTSMGIVNAYLRKTASPYTALIASQKQSFGVGRTDHEFLFSAPTAEAGGSFVIEVEQTSGTTYIDEIELYEANATVLDVRDQVRFEYNAGDAAKTISLGDTYTAVDGTVYNGSITLQPYTSKILVKDTGATTTPPPVSAALKATATPADINCFDGTSNITVTATGGTAPYSGTGSYNVSAGKGSLKFSFPTSIEGEYGVVFQTIGAISNAKNYVLRFSTLGTTGNGKLKAYLRMTESPWLTLVAEQTGTFGTTRKDHEFLFTAPPTESAASFIILIDQSSGTTYIDNIAFFESGSDGTLKSANLFEDGDFEGGNINTVKVQSLNDNLVAVWDGNSKINGVNYFTVKDATNEISVAVVNTSQPAAPLQISVTAGVLSVLGGEVPVTVSATGGTAPYTGTGSFSAGAGTHVYTVTDANGCAVSEPITVSLVAARGIGPASTTAVADPLSTELATANKTLSVSAYPNPTTKSFSLMVEGGSNEKINIAVYNQEGKLLYQTSGNSNTNYSFGNEFLPGIYIARIVQGTAVQTVKLVKAN